MNAPQYHSLVQAVVRSGFAAMEKSAFATPEQQEILQAGWPQDEEGLSKLASLSRVLATGLMVEEAEMAEAAEAAAQ
jgi:hypothetical protein